MDVTRWLGLGPRPPGSQAELARLGGGWGVGDEYFEVGGVSHGCREGGRGIFERERAGDDGRQVNGAGGGELDRRRERTGVAERGDEVDLVALEEPQRDAVHSGLGLA